MPHIEVKTKLRVLKTGPEVLVDLVFVPRGSGNRNKARQVAQILRVNPRFKPHVRKVVVGASRVTVHLIPTFDLLRDLEALKNQQTEAADVPGQLRLFAT